MCNTVPSNYRIVPYQTTGNCNLPVIACILPVKQIPTELLLHLSMSTATKNHIGRKISRIRELRDMKQEALAAALGISQQAVSNIENSETIEESKLQEIARVLGVTTEAIKNFSDESVFNYFNNFSDNSINQGPIGAHNTCNFNPLDKVLELFEEKEKLYERLLQAEKDKVVYLEKLLGNK